MTALDLDPIDAELKALAERVMRTGPERQKRQVRDLLAARIAARAAARAQEAPDPLTWGQKFFPHLMTAPASDLHRDLAAWYGALAVSHSGQMDAYAAPRGHGKSTFGTEIGVLWCIAHRVRRFPVIIASTADQAEKRLETVTREIETNGALQEAYPELRPAMDGQGQLVAWRDRDIALANSTRVVATSVGKSIRGLKDGAARPDLLILDDFEDPKTVATAEQILKTRGWLLKDALALAGPLDPLDVLWIGTILSRSALLNLATGAALDSGQTRSVEWARWTPHVYRAEVAGSERVETTVTVDLDGEQVTRTYHIGEPMWREALTREDLAERRLALGDDAYASEWLNDPAAAGGVLARPLPADWVNADAPPLERVVRRPDGQLVPVRGMVRASALDPQFADPAKSSDPDLAAVVTVGRAGAWTFILDSWIGRDREGQAARLVGQAQTWGCYAAAVETNAAQVLLADQAAALGRVPIIRKPSTEGKVQRALELAVPLGQGLVCVLPGGHNGDLPGYVEAFPAGRYDDPVDALVMAHSVASAGGAAVAGGGPVLGGARKPLDSYGGPSPFRV